MDTNTPHQLGVLDGLGILRVYTFVALRYRLLEVDRTIHRFNRTGKLGQDRIASGVENPAAVFGNEGINNFTARIEAFQRPLFML